MKVIIKFIFVLALFCSAGTITAQSSNMDYVLQSQTVSISGVNSPIVSTLNKSNNQIVWLQQFENNESTTVFDISSTSGEWDPNTNTGSLSHTVYMEGVQGVFTLNSTASGIIVSLNITEDETQEQYQYTIFINTITYQ